MTEGTSVWTNQASVSQSVSQSGQDSVTGGSVHIVETQLRFATPPAESSRGLGLHHSPYALIGHPAKSRQPTLRSHHSQRHATSAKDRSFVIPAEWCTLYEKYQRCPHCTAPTHVSTFATHLSKLRHLVRWEAIGQLSSGCAVRALLVRVIQCAPLGWDCEASVLLLRWCGVLGVTAPEGGSRAPTCEEQAGRNALALFSSVCNIERAPSGVLSASLPLLAQASAMM
eukprot:6128139-Pyramimonas_sp.AAC.2